MYRMKKLIMAMLIAVSMVPTISAQDNNRQRMTTTTVNA